jgi:hypothetical protein
MKMSSFTKRKNNNKIPSKDKTISNEKDKSKLKINNDTISSFTKRRIKIDRQELYKIIKGQFNDKKGVNNKKKEVKKMKNKISKKKEYSKIIYLDDEKSKKSAVNYYKKINNNDKIDVNKTRRESLKCKINNFSTNKTNLKKNIQNKKKPANYNINKDIFDKINLYTNGQIKKSKLIDLYNKPNISYIISKNPKKFNIKKPLIKIITNNKNNFCYNKKRKETSKHSNMNNSQIIFLNQDDLLSKLQNMLPKKKSMMNNSFTINNKLVSNTSRKAKSNQNNKVNNILFQEDNLEALPSDYDDKFNDLYSVINKINFSKILRDSESIFSVNSQKYNEFKAKFDFEFLKNCKKSNLCTNKMKCTKKCCNYSSSKTDFSSSNKNLLKNVNSSSLIVNDFELLE